MAAFSGGGRSTASTSSPALLQWSGERCVPQGDSAARSAKRPLPGVERRSARGDRPWHARARSWQRPPRRGLPCRRCWSATQVRSSGSTELLLRGRRDGKGECPSSLTSSRTAFSCTSRQRRSTSTGVRRWNATNVGGAKKQTERAARWNHPRSSSAPLWLHHGALRRRGGDPRRGQVANCGLRGASPAGIRSRQAAEDAVRLDLGGRAGNGNAARPMRGCAGCPTSRRESEPAPFHDPGRRTAKLPPASGGDACRRLNARLHESGRPGSNRRRPAWEASSALAGQGFFGGGSRNGITQYRSATPRFAILARTETADSPAGAFPSSRAPHRPWQDLGRVREVTKSEPRRDDRRARDANPEPSRDPLGQKARPARTST